MENEEEIIDEWEIKKEDFDWFNQDIINNIIDESTSIEKYEDGSYLKLEYLDENYLLTKKEEAKFLKTIRYNNKNEKIEEKLEKEICKKM